MNDSCNVYSIDFNIRRNLYLQLRHNEKYNGIKSKQKTRKTGITKSNAKLC